MLPTSATSPPLVSIVICYFNRPEYIQDSIESALNQTHSAIEVIVVDDGSTEEAHRVLLTIPGPTIIRQENGGVAVARNRGLTAARGEYIIFLDHDDRLLPNAVESHLRAIAGKVPPGLIFAAVREIDKAGRVTGQPYVCAPRRNYYSSMLESNPIHCPAAAMITRKAFLAVGGMDPEVAPSEDYDLYLRLAKQYPVIRHAGLVAEYRIHDTNVSRDRAKMIHSTNAVFDKLERTTTLSPKERRRVRLGRMRTATFFSDRKSLWQRLQVLYFRLRSLSQSSFSEMLRER